MLDQEPVTLLFIAASVAVSLYAFTQSPDRRPDERFLFQPWEVARGRNLQGMLLSQFSHGDYAHLIFNMITLWFFGPTVEGPAEAGGLGRVGLVAVYVASAIGSTLLTFALHRNDPGYRALGASGAITGVLFAAIVVEPTSSIYFSFVPVPIPAPVFAVVYIVASSWASSRQIGNVAHEAHIGGALTGFAAAAALAPAGLAPLVSSVRGLMS